MRFIRQHCKNTPSVRKRTVGSQLKRTVSKSLCPKSVVLSNSVPLHVTDIQVNKTILGVKTINGAYQARKVIFLETTTCPTMYCDASRSFFYMACRRLRGEHPGIC
jgi:hypothetical protein